MVFNSFKLVVYLMVFLGFYQLSYSQSLTQTIKGQIINAETGVPISGATIQLLGETTKGSISDSEGYFVLEEVPVGRQSLLCEFLGFEDYIVSEILVGSAKEINLIIPLLQNLDSLEEVVIVSKKNRGNPNNTLATVSARSFSVEETKRFPASISDPGRMALSFAGVSSSDDATNEIIIRGNAPNQLLWKIEGIEVPSPNHFSAEGFSAGAVSILSTNMLGKSDFFTGAFPAEYGNALSGVFDINLRNGNNSKGEYTFQLGVLGTDIAAEGPFSKNYKGSYLINYRYSTLSLLNNVVEVSENSVPVFQDLSFKLHLPLSTKTKLNIWGIGGLSENNNDNEEQDDPNFESIEAFKSNTYLSGITLTHFFKDDSSLNIIASYSGSVSDESNRYRSLVSTYEESNATDLKNNAFRLSSNYTRKFGAKTTFKTGVVYSRLHYDLFREFSENGVTDTEVDEKGNGQLFQSFAQAKYRFSKNLWATAGVHATYFSINEDFRVEPRAGLHWKVSPKHSLNVGFGIHSRILPLNQYFVRVTDGNGNLILPNQNLKLQSATHYIIGYDWRLIKNGHLKIEAYFQDLNNVAVSANPLYTDATLNGELISDRLTDTGKGRNYGLEFTFEKFFSDQYYYLFTASLYNSEYQAANGEWYDSRYNYNYTFNAVGGKEFTVGKKENNVIGVNLRTLLNGGQRSTPIDIEASLIAGEEIQIQSQRNTTKLKDYFRLDTSFYFRLNRPKVSHVFSLDIQNVTNRKNIMEQELNFNTGEIETENQLSLIPILNYRLEF